MPEQKVPGMTREETQPGDGTGAGYAIPIQVGIIGGFFAVWIPLVIGISIFWEFPPFLGFNFQFENTPQIQIFLLFFTGLILIGYITGYLTAALVRKLSGTIRAGIISGFFSALVLIVCMRLFSSTILIHKIDYVTIFTHLEMYIPVIISFIFFSIVFQVLGAILGYFWYRNRQRVSPSQENSTTWEWVIIKPAVVTIVMMLAIIIIPIMYSYSAPPKPDYQKCFMFTGDYAKVERLSEDTIKITQIGANSPADCLSDKPYLIKISLNDKDVSDLASIQKKGLPDTIDPPEGLVYGNGSTVVIEGQEVSNKTHAPLIKIMKNMQSRDGTLVPLSLWADEYV
jgi:hypothetical protein